MAFLGCEMALFWYFQGLGDCGGEPETGAVGGLLTLFEAFRLCFGGFLRLF
jgi:hypothetical protein